MLHIIILVVIHFPRRDLYIRPTQWITEEERGKEGFYFERTDSPSEGQLGVRNYVLT